MILSLVSSVRKSDTEHLQAKTMSISESFALDHQYDAHYGSIATRELTIFEERGQRTI